MPNIVDLADYFKHWESIITLALGGLSKFFWGADKHTAVMKRKGAVLRSVRFQLSIEMLQRVLPPLGTPLSSEQDYKERFKENATEFLASQDKRLWDFIRTHNHFGIYTIAYNAHRYLWPIFAATGFGGWLHFASSKPWAAWGAVIIGSVGIILPWATMIYQSDRLDSLAGEYDAAE